MLKAKVVFWPLVLAITVLILISAVKAKAQNPISRLHSIRSDMRQLLVPGPAGWMMVRDVPRYQWLERQAAGAWHTIVWNPYWAIQYVFGPYAGAAWNVARCEGGNPVPSPNAHNGQYLGMFQMGSSERRLYGHGPSPMEQARAAFRYSNGGRNWGPWQCKP